MRKYFCKNDIVVVFVLMFIFWAGVFRQIELPGLYMDAINPDYLAARVLNPAQHNPAWILPTWIFPVLGNLYHGVQTLYVDVIAFTYLGISITSVRIAQALFGAGIVCLFYMTSVLVTKNRLAAFLGAALLASDIAFLASYRTQFYIILSGSLWLFASIFALWQGGRRGYLISGIFYGLSIYGYFVFGFFFPGMIILILLRHDRGIFPWIVGFAVGMLPYVVGYLFLVVGMHGWSPALNWIRAAVGGLAPMSSHLSVVEGLRYTAFAAWLAMTNAGNEIMIFGRQVSAGWGEVKVGVFCLIFITLLFRIKKSRDVLLLILPVSYVLIAATLGNRLWAHHFIVLLPIAYLLLTLSLGALLNGGKIHSIVVIFIAVIFFAGNLYQANMFHRELDLTGGVKMYSSALTRLAEDAQVRDDTLYVFPDWGFFMSFNLLTQNKVPYVIDAGKIDGMRKNFSRIEIAFWSANDRQKYSDLLKREGANDIQYFSYKQRDGQVAFSTLVGIFPNEGTPPFK
jgi:hypothetical protein